MPKENLNLAVLEWIALIPWFLSINNTHRHLHAFLISFWTGILFWGITIYWLRLVTGFGFFLLLPYLGLYFAVFGLCVSYIRGRRGLIFFLAPLFWILLELVRGFLIGGFPWLNLCHGQYLNIMLLQWASIGGENIISGMVILINIFGAEIILSRGKIRYLLFFTAFFILIFIHAGGKFMLLRDTDKQNFMRIAVIQPNIIEEKWDRECVEKNFKILLNLSCESLMLKEKPEFIIWPETSFGYDLESDRIYLEILKQFSSQYNCYLLAGSAKEIEPGKFYNRALLISPENKISSYDKLKLVPFGEYVPMGGNFPWFKKWVEDMTGYRFSFISGKEGNPLSIKDVPFGVLICFEDIFPHLSVISKNRGAKFLVNITDDHWFGRTAAPYQHLAASVLRAVETRCPLVRAANSGVSAFIDSNGRIVDMVKDENSAIFIRGYCVREIPL